MDETPKKTPTLPADYVSLAQLREKWLLKQQQVENDTNQNAAVTNQETDGTQLNGVENKKKNKKKRSKKKKKQPLVGEIKVEDNQNEEFSCEIDKKNESERVEIVPKNPIGVQQKNGNNGGASNGTRVKLVGEKKYNNGYNKWGNRKRVDESSKGGEKSKKLEEVSKSEVLEVCMRVEGLEVKETDGFYKKDDSFVGVELNDEKLVGNWAKDDDEKMEARNEFGRRWWSGNEGRKSGRDRRLGKRKGVGGNKLEKSGVESSKGDKKGKGSDEMSKSETVEVGVKLEGLKVKDGNRRKADGVVVVGLNVEQIVGNETKSKNDDKGEAGKKFGKNKNGSGNVERSLGRPAFGNRRLGNKKTVRGNRSEKIVAELKDRSKKSDEKEQDLDGMSKSEVLEVGVKLDGLKVIDLNAKDDSVVGVGLNDDQIAENEKEESGNEFGKYRNRSGNVERKYGHAGYGDRRLGNALRNRNSGGSGKLGSGRMNHRANGMVWVKREEKSSANTAQVGFTGI